MPFTQEQRDHLEESYDEWMEKKDDLSLAILRRSYRTDRGREFATHGLGRRVAMLGHCMFRVFESVPLCEENPSRTSLMDATAFIQTFVINTFGAIDNIAHVWCEEAQVRDAKGNRLKSGRIGLTPANTLVRETLSLEFQAYLAEHDEWFHYQESYRHSLAHRIPLYVPSRMLNPESARQLANVEAEKEKAFADHDWHRANELMDSMERIGVFNPQMMHSFGEQARPMIFHAQMICDLGTVVEIGQRLLAELDALP